MDDLCNVSARPKQRRTPLIDDPFYGQLPDGERPDIMLYIFPHLKEFLVVDLRGTIRKCC